MNAIEINNLTKSYGKSRGVVDISLNIEKGEFFGFIGPNGAGKSTTIRALLGLLSPTKGTCSVLGADCWKDKTTVLQSVGYLPSENAYYQGMRVDEILRLSAKLRGCECDKEASRLCDALQLEVHRKASELSYGNRKKLSIVCALQHNPEVLILDEPTGGLDPLMQKAFFDLLRERHESGTTIFLSSHILSEVQNHCDRTAVIRNGQIIACDRIENLKQNNVRRIHLIGEADLAGLDGVRNLVQTSDQSSFLYNGEIAALLRVLSSGNIRDLSIQEPDLEEVFMHYYE